MLKRRQRFTRYRPLGAALTALPYLTAVLPGLLAFPGLTACDTFKPSPESIAVPDSVLVGSVTPPIATFAAVSAGPDVIVIAPELPIVVPAQSSAPTQPATPPLLGAEQVLNEAPARRVLYSWTTPEQVAEIRSSGKLLTRSERPGEGRGHALDSLATFGAGGTDSAALLAVRLTGPGFSKVRYAWTEAWATRLGWPGETYGNQLLRIVLRPEAWIVKYSEVPTSGQRSFSVTDLQNQPVLMADAEAHPERIAGVFFTSETGACQRGSLRADANGYREFVVLNETMVEVWSIAGAEAEQHLTGSINLLTQFLEHARAVVETSAPQTWATTVTCLWHEGSNLDLRFPSSEHVAYARALAIPSPGYLPGASNLATLIDTLTLDLADMRGPAADAAAPSSTVTLEPLDAAVEEDAAIDQDAGPDAAG